MIPKVIHYCWFGGNPLPEDAKRCIASWRRYMPDYEIKEWNETNFDVHVNTYCSQAYEAKKYAFVSDYARLWVLYNYGGVYFDTDVEVIKPLSNILQKGAYMGCETSPTEKRPIITVNPGLGFAIDARHAILKELLDNYDQRTFIKDDGKLDQKTIVATTTEILLKHGLECINGIQDIEGITIYPKEYFCPIGINGDEQITTNTYTIHHFAQSWRSPFHVWLRTVILTICGWRFKSLLSRIFQYIRKS